MAIINLEAVATWNAHFGNYRTQDISAKYVAKTLVQAPAQLICRCLINPALYLLSSNYRTINAQKWNETQAQSDKYFILKAARSAKEANLVSVINRSSAQGIKLATDSSVEKGLRNTVHATAYKATTVASAALTAAQTAKKAAEKSLNTLGKPASRFHLRHQFNYFRASSAVKSAEGRVKAAQANKTAVDAKMSEAGINSVTNKTYYVCVDSLAGTYSYSKQTCASAYAKASDYCFKAAQLVGLRSR